MGHMQGDAGSQSAVVTRVEHLRESAELIPEQQLGTSHAALPRTDHEEAKHPPRTGKEKPGENPTAKKRNPTRNFLRSCCPSQSRP